MYAITCYLLLYESLRSPLHDYVGESFVLGACGRTGRKYCYLMNWNKERFYLAILTLPAIYFMWKVFNYNYFEPDSVFIEELSGLVLSLLIVILYLIRLNKKH